MAKNSITTHPTIAHLLAILILILASGGSFCANANSMPADQLIRLSNRELCEIGQTYWDKNQLDSALICFNIVANRADRKQSREELGWMIGATSSMASIYTMRFYDYDCAMNCLLKSEKYARKHHFGTHLADIYELMATLEQAKSDLLHDFSFNPEAFELHRKAFNLAVKYGEPHHVMVISISNLITTALTYHKLNLIKKELNIFQNYKIFDSIPGRQFTKHQCTAAIYAMNEQYDSSIVHLSQLENSINGVGFSEPDLKIAAHDNMYSVYRDMGNSALALKELDNIERIASYYKNKVGLLNALHYKREFYVAQGNKTLAQKYDLLFLQLKDQLLEESKAAKADEEKVLFKLNEADHEIKELYYKQRIQQTELIAIAVVAVLLLMLLVIGWMSYRRMQEKNQTLYQHNMQLIANEDRLRQLQQAEKQPAPEPTAKYRRSNMEGEEISLVMAKVDRVMESSPEIYSTDFSLERLAELTGESRIRLSQAINQVPGRTFYSILNGYRVREACRRMDDKEQYGGLTIEAIGQSVGFKNRSSFVAIFKRITGLTPSAYLKQPTAPDSPTPETHADNAEI